MKTKNPKRTTKSANITSIIAVIFVVIFILLSVLDILKPSIENQYPFFNKLWGFILGASLLSIILTIYFTLRMPKYKNESPKKINHKASLSKIENDELKDNNINNEQALKNNINEFNGTFDDRMTFQYKEDSNGDLSYILKPKVKIINE